VKTPAQTIGDASALQKFLFPFKELSTDLEFREKESSWRWTRSLAQPAVTTRSQARKTKSYIGSAGAGTAEEVHGPRGGWLY